ncbi:MAG: alanine--tRNA ligase [Pseudomonadota bacterium]
MVSVNEVRRTFLKFFEAQGHEIVDSGPLVPRNDPTLMFTNAGMNQFKDVFTGKETPPYTRATTAQKCVRAGGKHNDLENVGYTKRHHTFFEMMGNFSFGDYFKEEAIKYSWDLVTKEFGLPKEKLLVTVYADDDEAFSLWKKIAGLPDEKIIRIATSDNFWSMGDTGPCGPCSEIFFDHGEHIPGGPPGSPDEDGDRFIEIWNIVFMQYEQITVDERRDLPKPCIDTGMGLERMAATLMGTNDNYAIDIIRNIIEDAANRTSSDPDGPLAVSHRVIADHLRSVSFLIAAGVLPSNEGRGYVLRRIMRRGMRHAHLLGAKDPLMHELVPGLISSMGDMYPELKEANSLITETLRLEELRFKKTLEKGLGLLEAETRDLGADEKLSGEVAFKLYDTYGFPLDLTQDVLRRDQNRDVDTAGFDAAMEQQREQARAAWKGSGSDAANEKLWFDIKDRIGVADFLGYETEEAEAILTALVDAQGQETESLKAGESGILITNQTPFYGESGGQVGDTGVMKTVSGADIVVTDTQKKLGDLFIHHVTVNDGAVTCGDTVQMKIDAARRNDIRANHSATHLLNAALRRNLGDHVTQKGSLVSADRLRFDISHSKPLSAEEIRTIEDEVNERIRMNTETTTRLLPIEQARAEGAVAMFGEKYDDEVRVLTMGGMDPDQPDCAYSMELCGGTHVRRTGDIGLFKIIGESAVSSGVRRIEALSGRGALDFVHEEEDRLKAAAEMLKSSATDVTSRIKTLLADRKKQEQEIADLRRKIATGGAEGSNAPEIKDINGVKFIGRVLDDFPAKDLKPMADDLKAQMGSGVVTLIAVNDGKASIVVGVTDDLTATINAVDLVRIGSEKLGGKGGGGRPDMAQAGGPDASGADGAVGSIETALGE